MILSKESHAQEITNITFILYLCSHHPLAANYISWDSKDDKMTTQPYVTHCKLHTVCHLQVKAVSYILSTISCIIIFLLFTWRVFATLWTSGSYLISVAVCFHFLVRYTAKILFIALSLERSDFTLKKQKWISVKWCYKSKARLRTSALSALSNSMF